MRKIPEGYIVATAARYSGIRKEAGKEYIFSIQFLNQTSGDIVRGTGMTEQEAWDDAISKIQKDL